MPPWNGWLSEAVVAPGRFPRHEPRMNSSRRELLRSTALLGGALLFSHLLAACAVEPGADDGAEPIDEASDALVTCKPPVISANHGHSLVVSPADVAAGRAKTYSIQGASGHTHGITISAAQFAQLAAGQAIVVTSTIGAGHTHSVTVTCTASAPTTCGNGARASAISANHGHSLVVPKTDVAAGTSMTYSIQGSASHAHQVSINSAQFAALKSGKRISVTSSVALSHSHTVTVSCA